MLNYTNTDIEFVLPHEIVAYIFSFLPEEEILNLKEVCKTFKGALESSDFDTLYMPFLNRLKTLDPSISVLPPTPYHPHWIKGRVKAEFERLVEIQTAEIAHLKALFKEGSDNLAIQQHLDALMALKAPITLQDLEKNHTVLENLNVAMIEDCIDPSSEVLDISNKGITRLPAILLFKPELQDFWKKLTTLNCSQNNIFTIALNNLSALEDFRCPFNKISRIKVSGCPALTHFQCNNNLLNTLILDGQQELARVLCSSNKLSTLSVANCPALEKIDCDRNKLNALLLTTCIALKSLNCIGNDIAELDLTQCPHLSWLRADNNKLTKVTVCEQANKALSKRLGSGWRAEILNNQNLPSIGISGTLYNWMDYYVPAFTGWISKQTSDAPTESPTNERAKNSPNQ